MSGDDLEFDSLVRQSLDTCDADNDSCLNELVLHHMKQLGIDREKTIQVGTDDSSNVDDRSKPCFCSSRQSQNSTFVAHVKVKTVLL